MGKDKISFNEALDRAAAELQRRREAEMTDEELADELLFNGVARDLREEGVESGAWARWLSDRLFGDKSR
jgi:hypothetical protein